MTCCIRFILENLGLFVVNFYDIYFFLVLSSLSRSLRIFYLLHIYFEAGMICGNENVEIGTLLNNNKNNKNKTTTLETLRTECTIPVT